MRRTTGESLRTVSSVCRTGASSDTKVVSWLLMPASLCSKML
jgi:hypothetical protein